MRDSNFCSKKLFKNYEQTFLVNARHKKTYLTSLFQHFTALNVNPEKLASSLIEKELQPETSQIIQEITSIFDEQDESIEEILRYDEEESNANVESLFSRDLTTINNKYLIKCKEEIKQEPSEDFTLTKISNVGNMNNWLLYKLIKDKLIQFMEGSYYHKRLNCPRNSSNNLTIAEKRCLLLFLFDNQILNELHNPKLWTILCYHNFLNRNDLTVYYNFVHDLRGKMSSELENIFLNFKDDVVLSVYNVLKQSIFQQL